MNFFLVFVVAFVFSSLVFTFADEAGMTTTTKTKRTEEVKPIELSKTTVKRTTKVKAEKNVKTNGEISTTGCETASGKTLSENDFGYADCVKQIGIKK